MRWKKQQYKLGSVCQRQGFLWFRKTISGETRWLEFARWEEEVYMGAYTGGLFWRETRWL